MKIQNLYSLTSNECESQGIQSVFAIFLYRNIGNIEIFLSKHRRAYCEQIMAHNIRSRIADLLLENLDFSMLISSKLELSKYYLKCDTMQATDRN